jgi:hypothetical protein
MSNDVPLLVQFDFEQGTLQFFLAPKVCFFFLSGRMSCADDRSPTSRYNLNRKRGACC